MESNERYLSNPKEPASQVHYPRQAVSSHDWCWVSSVRCMRKVDALESNIDLSETKIAQNLEKRNIIFEVRIAT